MEGADGFWVVEVEVGAGEYGVVVSEYELVAESV